MEESAADDDLAPAHCPCTHSLVMHWFSLGPPISSETAPLWTKTGLYGCAHYVNNNSHSFRTQPPPWTNFLCIGGRYSICGTQVRMAESTSLTSECCACLYYLGGWIDSLTFSACTCYWLECLLGLGHLLIVIKFFFVLSTPLFVSSWQWTDGTDGPQ